MYEELIRKKKVINKETEKNLSLVKQGNEYKKVLRANAETRGSNCSKQRGHFAPKWLCQFGRNIQP